MGDFRGCRQSENVDETKIAGHLPRIMPNTSSPSNAQLNQVNLGNSTQGKGEEVDGEEKKAQSSRARDGGEVDVQKPNPEKIASAIETHSQMAKGAGSIRSIIDTFPEIRAMMVAEAVRGLAATVQCWNAKQQCYEEKIDYATRQKWVAWLAGYSDGLPVQTNMNFNAFPGSKRPDVDEAALALSSPALREELKRQIAEAEKRDRSLADKKSAVSV